MLIHSIFLFLLPILVALGDWSVLTAILAVLLALLWRWAISLSGILRPARTPALELETISASHFVEKVRWCLDRLGVEYKESPSAGAIGAFFLGRTVPRLRFRTGAVRSEIGNSAEILRYLWGRYACDEGLDVNFLKPTTERLEMESRIDRIGVDLQVWVYHHILDDRQLTLEAWGHKSATVPAWQRMLLPLLFPVLRLLIRRSFRITPSHHAKAVQHIDAFLNHTEKLLADGRHSLSGGDYPDFADFSFAAISGLWLQPENYGNGKGIRLDPSRMPAKQHAEVTRWRGRFPLSTNFIEDLYREQRSSARPDQ